MYLYNGFPLRKLSSLPKSLLTQKPLQKAFATEKKTLKKHIPPRFLPPVPFRLRPVSSVHRGRLRSVVWTGCPGAWRSGRRGGAVEYRGGSRWGLLFALCFDKNQKSVWFLSLVKQQIHIIHIYIFYLLSYILYLES